MRHLIEPMDLSPAEVDGILNLADKIIDHYNHVDILPISFLKEKTLSGTSGGVKKCQNFFNKGEDFVVLSADGVFDLDLQDYSR